MNSLEPLIKALKSADPETRAAAAEALGREKHPQAVEILIAVLNEDADSRVRLKAAGALQQSRDGRAVEALVRVLRESAVMY